MKTRKNILKRLSGIIDHFCEEDSGRFRFSERTLQSRSFTDMNIASEFLGLTRMQTLLFAVAVQLSDGRASLSRMADFMGMNYIDLLTFGDDFKVLSDKWLIRITKRRNVRVDDEVIQSLLENKKYEIQTCTNSEQILGRMYKMYKSCDNGELSIDELVEQTEMLLGQNPKCSLNKTVSRLRLKKIAAVPERGLFYILSAIYYKENDDEVVASQIDDCFNDDYDNILHMAWSDKLELQKQKIITHSSSGGMFHRDCLKIDDEVKKELFADAGGIIEKTETVDSSILDCKKITEKTLFYDTDTNRQVSSLESLMDDKRLKEVEDALKSKGLRTGFTVLFYGAPGTGKTETVYQLARKSGRNLLVADVSKLKDCYVGESEKNVKGLFEKYRNLVENSSKTPILLFNEADAIFGIRREGAERAVDKMENSIQNIILQEMENLKGILIATTNLTNNLDKAFERRFLYKVCFEKPSAETKSKIWESMIPELNKKQSLELAKSFDFSGGQIENVARKKMITSVIDGKEPSFEQLMDYCNEEAIEKNGNNCKIGF